MKLILCIFFSTHFGLVLNSQSNEIKYFAQYYNYGLNEMNGTRQTLIYSYGVSKRISIEGQVITGSGNGKDISNNFSKDFALLSKSNTKNVPEFLISFNEFYEGIYTYNRISESLKQDNGWGISLNYLIIKNSKLNLDLSLGYITYKTKAIIRENIIDLKITFPNDPSIKDYQISYPAAIHMNFNDGSGFSRLNASYNFKSRLSFGVSGNVNYSIWGSGIDIGIGIGLTYVLNNRGNE